MRLARNALCVTPHLTEVEPFGGVKDCHWHLRGAMATFERSFFKEKYRLLQKAAFEGRAIWVLKPWVSSMV